MLIPLGQALGIDAPQIVMIAAAIAILTLVMITTQRRMRAAQRVPQPSVMEQHRETAQRIKARDGLEQVMLELDQLCRQLHGRLDTKIARLEAVIRDADRKIETLSRLVRAAGGQPALEITLDRVDPHALAGVTPPEDDKHAPIYELADQGFTSIDIAQQVGMPTGEVELILSLRNARRKKGGLPGYAAASGGAIAT